MDIYSYITSEEKGYQTIKVPIVDGYEWNMFQHIKLCTLYKNSKYENSDDDVPFRNIIRPIVNVAYRSEGFDVKDIEPFVNDSENYYKSLIVRKYHEKWARKNDLDTFIDEVVESYIDYGGALVKNVNDKRPELVPLQRIAFCDQTNLLSGPICEKHQFSPDELKDMEAQGWGDSAKGATTSIDALILLSEQSKDVPEAETNTKTPGKYIQVYELHGTLPAYWVDNGYDSTDKKYIRQMQVVAFYKDKDGKKIGVTLYKGRESKDLYKVILRDKVYGRALGVSAIEELFEPQVWTNYDIIQQKELLDIAALFILQTADKKLAERNKVGDFEKGQILYYEEGKELKQVQTSPINMTMFENSIKDWENLARVTGSANDPLLGESPSAGTPFKLQALITQEGQGLHEYRQGKISTFVAEIYRDWILKFLVREMNKKQEFMAEFSLDELQKIADIVITNQANEAVKEAVLSGKIVKQQDVDTLVEVKKTQFLKGGTKKFFSLLENELATIPVDVEINIKGKQKDLSKIADGLTNVFRQVFANPAVLNDPRLAKIFNEILESSGFSAINFGETGAIKSPIQAQDLNTGNGQNTSAGNGVNLATAQ